MILRVGVAAIVLSLTALVAAAEPSVFLARHAEKAQGAGVDPKNPELSAAGRERAESLARMLRDAGVVAIFTTELKRTQETAEAISRVTGIQVSVVPAKDISTLIEKLKTIDGHAAVIGHSNTLPEIIKAFGVEKPITIGDDEYDNLFIWTRSAPRDVIRLRY